MVLAPPHARLDGVPLRAPRCVRAEGPGIASARAPLGKLQLPAHPGAAPSRAAPPGWGAAPPTLPWPSEPNRPAGERARRRNPAVYPYASEMCKLMRLTGECELGDRCGCGPRARAVSRRGGARGGCGPGAQRAATHRIPGACAAPSVPGLLPALRALRDFGAAFPGWWLLAGGGALTLIPPQSQTPSVPPPSSAHNVFEVRVLAHHRVGDMILFFCHYRLVITDSVGLNRGFAVFAAPLTRVTRARPPPGRARVRPLPARLAVPPRRGPPTPCPVPLQPAPSPALFPNPAQFWLHPERYRTQHCKDGRLCDRKVVRRPLTVV